MPIHEQQQQQQQQQPDVENCHKGHYVYKILHFSAALTLFAVDKYVCCDCHGSGSKTAAVPSSSGPSCRPPWVTDPEFATRFRPDKTSTVITQHQQPVQPTPMQNRSSILQAAQQAPEDGSRTPVCGACNKIIRSDSSRPHADSFDG